MHESVVIACFDKWVRLLKLGDWTIDVHVGVNDVVCTGVGSEHKRHFMSVQTHWQYMQATVWVDKPQLDTFADNRDINQHVVHELLHVLLAERVDTIEPAHAHEDKHEERVVTMLSKRMVELYNHDSEHTDEVSSTSRDDAATNETVEHDAT